MNTHKKRSGFKVMTSLIGLVKPMTGYMILAILMGLMGHLCASFITISGGFAILSVLGKNSLHLAVIFVAMAGMAVLRAVLRYAEQSCNHFIAFKLLALIRDKVFGALRKLCPAKLEGRDKGDLISVITSDIELLEVFYAHTISPVAIAALFTVIMCIFIGSYNPLLGVIALAAYITVGVIIPLAVSKLSGDMGLIFRTKSGELSAFVLDSLRGLPQIQQFGTGRKRLAQMNEKMEELSENEAKMKCFSGRNTAITNTVILFFDVLILFASGMLFVNGAVEFDGVLIPVIALMSSFGPVVALAALGSTLQNTFAAGNRVLDILEEKPVVEEVSGKQNIEFNGASSENVTFAYGDETILDNVSVDIPKNSVIGIAGRSGSGKSTFLKLFMRFWNVDNGSIKNNIKIAKLDATDVEVYEACKKASVHDFIMGLPKGYDTPVGELGGTLSGGEKQRIGLARAFLHNADMMLLDEPTSNLDSLNEAVILKSLHEERNGKTIVLVSHRKSSMRMVDRVYSVENGRMS